MPAHSMVTDASGQIHKHLIGSGIGCPLLAFDMYGGKTIDFRQKENYLPLVSQAEVNSYEPGLLA